MNKKRTKIAIIILFLFIGLAIVRAVTDISKITKIFETPETDSEFYEYSYTNKARSTFFKDGIVTYKNGTSSGYTLYYYDLKGKLLKTGNIKSSEACDYSGCDYQGITYMEGHGDFLYVLFRDDSNYEENGYILYKLNDSLKVIDKIELSANESEDTWFYDHVTWNYDYSSDPIAFTDESILLFIRRTTESYDDEEGEWVYDNSLMVEVDYDLNEATTITDSKQEKELFEKYFYEGYKSNGSSSSNQYRSFDVTDNYIILGDGNRYEYYDENGDWHSSYKSALYIINRKNPNAKMVINHPDYKYFYGAKVWEDMIITLAAKEEIKNEWDEVRYYKSDILFYSLTGEYIGKIEYNERLNYISIRDDYFAVNVEKISDESDEDSMSDSTSSFHVYHLPQVKEEIKEENKPLIPEDSPIKEIINPETSVGSIFWTILIALSAGGIFIFFKKKIKIFK